MQLGVIYLEHTNISLEFPDANSYVLPGVKWGAIETFLTPAYWAFQVYSQRLCGTKINYKLGTTLKEETAACLLGGHGIPAQVGICAFNHLKNNGIFNNTNSTEDYIYKLLSEPINLDGKKIKYRFAKQKAKYLANALEQLSHEIPSFKTGQELRNWLMKISGIGFKTASWIARNWLDADDVAILDIHILRAGILGGFFSSNLSVDKNYLELEEQFLKFSSGLGIKASELDAVIWLEMMSSSSIVHELIETSLINADFKMKKSRLQTIQLQISI
ncbi:8-oxoguanine DNA glycosylase [Acinetobacter sp. MB5]|uniref:8-oxoguanine DNA glycosylase n=1 Tax=Acinetobacter sp. MB5 TaxID=2069438 RepID=UPI000DCF64EC|nr:8-oxoguanine DNA glycosylase [Acinetobacter sp. MB5]